MTTEESTLRRAEQRTRAHRSLTFRRRMKRENPNLATADPCELRRIEDAMIGSERLKVAILQAIVRRV